MPTVFIFCSNCGNLLKVRDDRMVPKISTESFKSQAQKPKNKKKLAPFANEKLIDLPPHMKGKMDELMNRERKVFSPPIEETIKITIQRLELEAASVIEDSSKMTEESSHHERNSLHTFHPNSIILPTIAIDGTRRKLKRSSTKSRTLNTIDNDYLSHIAPISVYYQQYLDREKQLKGLHAMALDSREGINSESIHTIDVSAHENGSPSVLSTSESASAWLWGALGTTEEDNENMSNFTETLHSIDFSAIPNDEQQFAETNPTSNEIGNDGMFWGDIFHDPAEEGTKEEFEQAEIEQVIQSIEKERFREEFFQLFGYYPTEADLPGDFENDADGVPKTTADNYAKKMKVKLVEEAIENKEAKLTAEAKKKEAIDDVSQSMASIEDVRGIELSKIKQLYNKSIINMNEEESRISFDLGARWQKNKDFIRNLRLTLQGAKAVIDCAAKVETEVQEQFGLFKEHCSRSRSAMALQVAQAMLVASQMEASYREKYNEAAAAFKERDSGSQLQLSTEKHIVSNKLMDSIKERASADISLQGEIVKNLQAKESQLLLEIRFFCLLDCFCP